MDWRQRSSSRGVVEWVVALGFFLKAYGASTVALN